MDSNYMFKVETNKAGEYVVKFYSKNGNLMVWSEGYKSKDSAMNCIKALQENAAHSPVMEA